MSNSIWQILKFAPAVLGASLMLADAASAQTAVSNDELLGQVSAYGAESSASMSQVTNVSELTDVSPGDWAFEALTNLVERYGCIEGYPNRTFRGNRATTRYEFAAGLNACLNSIERLIANSEAVLREDIAALQRLVQEFEAELAALGARVDNLEGRVAFLEDHQFSTTTKLKGEVIFALAQAFGDEPAVELKVNSDGTTEVTDDDNSGASNTTFSDRVRLNFDTSFTGKDRLRVRLEAGNNPEFDDIFNTDTARTGYEETGGNNVSVQRLQYKSPLGDRMSFVVVANDGDTKDLVRTVSNPFFSSSGSGATSRFGRRNPAVHRVLGQGGLGVNYEFTDAFSVDVIYGASNMNSPVSGEGLFNGDFATGVQFNFLPESGIDASLTYIYGFQPGADVNTSGSTIDGFATEPFGEVATTAHRIGVQGTFPIGDRVSVGGWFGSVFASARNGAFDDESTTIINALLHTAFKDVGKEGNILGVLFGIPPYVVATDYVGDAADDFDDIPLFAELQYRFKVNKNILITPAVYGIFNANQSSDNDAIFVGQIRTTFKF